MEYQELIKVIRDELESSKLIARVENDDIPSIDLKKRSLYPLAAFYIDSVEVTSNVNTFTVQLLVADILDVNKQTNQDNQDFIWNQSIAVINNLYNKLNRGLLFEQLVQEIESINLTPFTDRLDKGLAGMETTLTISVKNNMTLCKIPFKMAENGVTVLLKSGYPAGTTGKAQGDNSGKVYTAVNETQLRTLNVDTYDFSSVCTTLVTNMGGMFRDAGSANPDVSNWDVSNVTDMDNMFFAASSANPDTSNWDVSSVTTMRLMFFGATSANPDTSNWNVSNVTTMRYMFYNATSANPDTTNWDVSSVTDMRRMFQGASSANPVTTNWDVSNVTDMFLMFSDSFNANPDCRNWDVSNVTRMTKMFNGTNLSVENLTACYENWSQLNLQQNVEFSAGSTKYNASGQAGRDILVNTYNWTIEDGGLV